MNFGYIWRNLPPVTKNLLIINLLVWLAINLLGHGTVNSAIIRYGALHYFTSSDFLPSQLFTYMFMHESFWHLFFNMFALFMFGGIIERTLGSAKFLFYYVSCGVGAALIQLGVYAVIINHYESIIGYDLLQMIEHEGADILRGMQNFRNPDAAYINQLVNIPTLGASGAVYGILLAFGFLFPRQPIYLMFIPVPIQARWMVIGYGVIELLQAMNNNPADNVAHLAHLGGMIFGLLMLLYWKYNNRRA
ncbi:MAG: rhomboid family intramembrane serine protease [Bacteroidales bacterium]|nr:rhomboid family intramembrane serine protease [Bacteroidales bacterium]